MIENEGFLLYDYPFIVRLVSSSKTWHDFLCISVQDTTVLIGAVFLVDVGGSNNQGARSSAGSCEDIQSYTSSC